MQIPTFKRIVLALPTQPRFVHEFCQGVVRYRAKGERWLVDTVGVADQHLVDAARYHRYHGAILVDGVHKKEEDAQALDAIGVKVVQAWHPDVPKNFPAQRIGRVEIDDYRVGQMGAEHLMAQGFSRLAYFGWSADWSKERLRGFRETVHKAGRQCQEWITPPDTEWNDMVYGNAVTRWLDRAERPLAIMAFGDDGARRVLELCLERRWAVPAEVAVLGVDDLFFLGDYLSIPLSSIRFNAERMGYQAAALLGRMLSGGQPPRNPILIQPKEVIIRQSTHALQTDDPEVSRAIAYIRTHATDWISIDDLIDTLGISRSTLQRRFIKAVGYSPSTEIRRARLEAARRLLINTKMPLVEVAVACGFSSISNLSHSFQRNFGMSPTHCREIFS